MHAIVCFFRSLWISCFGNLVPHLLSFLARRRYPNVNFGFRAHANHCVFEGSNWINKGSTLGYVEMGRGSYCACDCRIGHCKIGRFCSIGSEVKIGLYIHPTNHVSTYPGFYSKVEHLLRYHVDADLSEASHVFIGHDVWIGDRAVIKNGVTIGHGAIVGACALVTKDVPPYAIVGGVPARVIRMRFSEEMIKELLRLQWWNWSDEQLKCYGHLFGNPEELLRHWAMQRF